MLNEAERIAAIADPCARLAAVTQRLAECGAEITELSKLRRDVVDALHQEGYSHARIAAAAGLSRGRIHQILHSVSDLMTCDTPTPEGWSRTKDHQPTHDEPHRRIHHP
jgi:DNA-directed RNA polymerase specialized sigma24 family protein